MSKSMPEAMTGAESLVRSLTAGGVDTFFTNPGTSEIHIVSALDRLPEMRCVLGLFEGVVTGAADGYARMAEKPACTLLHLGPGLGNGLANLHNASRAHVPMVNIVGQHPSYHLRHDTPLASDVEGIARPYSKWLRTSRAAASVGRDAMDAVVAARSASGQIATLIVPADVAWDAGGVVAKFNGVPHPVLLAMETIERTVTMLRSGVPTAMLMSGDALYGRGLAAAGRIATATGVRLLAPYPTIRLERGAGITAVDRLQYVLEQAQEQLKEFRQLILVGAVAPVAYFAYPGKDSVLTQPGCVIQTLATAEEDCAGSLEALDSILSSAKVAASRRRRSNAQLWRVGRLPCLASLRW